MFYALLADAALVLHAGFLVHLVVGGFVAWRWPRMIWLHAGVALWSFGAVVVGYGCPLTLVEDWARRSAGQAGLPPEGFIELYVTGVVYPAEYLVVAQSAVFLVVLLSWAGFYRRRRAFRSLDYAPASATPGADVQPPRE